MLSVQPHLDSVQTLPQLLAFRAATSPQGEAFREFDTASGRWLSLSWAATQERVTQWQRALAASQLPAGARVAILLPNGLNAMSIDQATLAQGAVPVPLHAIDNPGSIAYILADCEASLLMVTSTEQWEKIRGVGTPLPALRTVVVTDLDSPLPAATDSLSVVALADWLARGQANVSLATPPGPEDLATIVYTSGTTGKPKGCVWTHVGFLGSMVTRDMHICADFKSSDRFFFMSDMGWMVGAMCACIPSYFGGSLLVAEGTPDFPDTGRFWRLVQDHKVTYLGVAPTLIRSLMRYGDEEVQRYDLSSLRITCSGGEAWTEAPWRWFFKHICKEKLPFLNIVGGTEVGGCNFTGTLHHPLRPGSFGARGLGAGVDIVDESGQPVGAGQVGELVLRNPNIGFTKSLWRDDERYLDSYWRTIAGVWVHGDFAMRDADGLFYILGRSDDTIKVSGKRTGPSEIETLLTGTGKVSEAAVIGVPDEIKGSAIVCVCVPMPGVAADAALQAELSQAVVHGMGASYRPRQVLLVSDLPKTRNMKIMRRVVRAVYKGDSPGDLSSLVNPETVAELQGKLAKA